MVWVIMCIQEKKKYVVLKAKELRKYEELLSSDCEDDDVGEN